jgi:hypothetical protein
MLRSMKKLSLTAAALIAVTVGLAGCGGSGQAQPQRPSKDDYDRALKYAQCMQKYGVEVPVPDPDGGAPAGGERTFDPNDPKLAAARAACSKLAPAAHAEGKPPKELADHALKMAECLREQGINAKDPKPGENNLGIEEGPGYTPEKLRAAFTVCNKQNPPPKRK